MTACIERKVRIQKVAHVADDPGAALCVVAAGASRTVIVRDRIGAVERIVQAAPARIGRIQCVAGIVHRHHQLRPGHVRNLRVDVGGGDAECCRFGRKIADVPQERLVGRRVEIRSGMPPVPVVDLRLEQVAPLEELRVARRQTAHERGESAPKGRFVHAGARHCFVVDEAVQRRIDIDVIYADRLWHEGRLRSML